VKQVKGIPGPELSVGAASIAVSGRPEERNAMSVKLLIELQVTTDSVDSVDEVKRGIHQTLVQARAVEGCESIEVANSSWRPMSEASPGSYRCRRG
jgi:hypothetical protein